LIYGNSAPIIGLNGPALGDGLNEAKQLFCIDNVGFPHFTIFNKHFQRFPLRSFDTVDFKKLNSIDANTPAILLL
jgi:hypothetical protein